MAVHSIAERKQSLRAAMLSERRAVAQEASVLLSGAVQAKAIALPVCENASAVILYSPIEKEISTERIRDYALSKGKRVFYPKLTGTKSVGVAEIRSTADFVVGRLGILEPAGAPLAGEVDAAGWVIFLPGVAFDSHGNRLGRGVGWYDRLLHSLGERGACVGLAYEFQVVGEVPTDPWDERIDYVVTEERVINCRHSGDRWQPSPQYTKGGVL